MGLCIVIAAVTLSALLVPRLLVTLTPAPEVLREVMESATCRPPAPGVVHRDLTYPTGHWGSRRLDIYEPVGGCSRGEAPVVVFFHGGSWIKGDKVMIRIIDRFLTRIREAGCFLIAVNYTTTPLLGRQGPRRNCEAAIRWIRAKAPEYGYDPDNLGLYGVSAGGHLALLTLSTMEEVPFSFGFIECAPTDLVAMREGDAFAKSSVFRLLPEGRLRALSPITHIRANQAPVLIFHGDADRTVHLNQSLLYQEAAREVGAEVELEVYPGGDHAFLNFDEETWKEQEERAFRFMSHAFKRKARR
ncbi:MAG: alpha/beta hydrolase [Alkalispirochaetaceae bacterium]